MVEYHATREIELVNDLLELIHNASTEKIEGWEDAYGLTPTERREYLADEKDFQAEIFSQATQLAVVALNRVVELNTKRLLAGLQPAPDQRQLHKLDYFKRYLKRKHNMDVDTLPGFSSIDEIRELSNAVKHSRTVTRKLSQFPGWTHGAPLENLEEAYTRLAAQVPSFLVALEAQVPR